MSYNISSHNDFSKKFLDITVALSNAKNPFIPPDEQTYISILLSKKKLEKSYNDLCKNSQYSPLNAKTDSQLNTAWQIAEAKAEKFFRNFEKKFILSKATDVFLMPVHIELALLAEKQGFVFFGGQNCHSELACLALDFPCTIEFGGITFPSALHAFMAQTFPNNSFLQNQCAKLSKSELFKFILANGNHHSDWYNGQWNSEQFRATIMFHVLNAKFGQNPDLQKKLLSTIDASLVFVDDLFKVNSFWGAGGHGKGQNTMGKILMRIREKYNGMGETALPQTGHQELAKTTFKAKIPALDKEDAEILKEIQDLNNQASEEVYQKETTICKQTENHSKNRFNDYNYVFNKTLVQLSTGNYINANFLHNGSVIASQTPMPNTSEDFWQMALDQASKAVVMLNLPSDFVSFSYFPDSKEHPKCFGKIEVHLLEEPTIVTDPSWNQAPFEEEPHAFKIRKLDIKTENKSQKLTHYQYLNWRDLKIGNEGCVGELVIQLDNEQGSSNSPIIIHCLAGVGRTASTAAIYDQYRKWKNGQELNIREAIAEQRNPDQGRYYLMVQSPEQYAFCYSTLRYIINKMSKHKTIG